MNSFLRHHQADIAFHYSCFDRMLCVASIHQLQWGGGVVKFFRDQRNVRPITPKDLKGIANAYHRWLQEEAREAGLAIVEPPHGVRKEDFVKPYYSDVAERSGVAVILKCRERAKMTVCYAHHGNHLESEYRFVNLYYFYLEDAQLGRFFIRLCPYFPFNMQVCFNGHQWLARQMRREGIGFVQNDNAFTACDNPERLQQLADSFSAEHITAVVDPWIRRWLTYFGSEERDGGYRHQLYMAQVEYCDNLIFHRAAAADRLFSRLLDSNRTIGHPQKLAIIFGRPRFQADTRTAQTHVRITRLKTSVLSTGFLSTALKQYLKSLMLLRTESSSFQLKDLSIPKHISNLPRVRAALDRSNQRYLDAQQDILASYIDRGQLEKLRQPTVSPTGRRTPGLRLDDPRLLAVLQALTCFAYLVGKASFRTLDLLADVQRALANPDYRLSQLRYDLSKLRGKGLVVRVDGTQRYQVSPEGYRIAVLYQKLYHKLYAPLTAGLLDHAPGDDWILDRRKTKVDRLYEQIDQSLQKLSQAVGILDDAA